MWISKYQYYQLISRIERLENAPKIELPEIKPPQFIVEHAKFSISGYSHFSAPAKTIPLDKAFRMVLEHLGLEFKTTDAVPESTVLGKAKK